MTARHAPSAVAAEPLLVPLRGRTDLDTAAVGGKAAGLNWLAGHGFRCPPAACVTAAAYDAYVAAHGLGERLASLSASIADAGARSELETLLRAYPFPAGLGDELAREVEAWGGVDGGLLAVRSSGVGEDSSTMSFAGQHATVLGVAPADVEQAVRTCWLSLWSDRAVSYRANRGLGAAWARMAVVVQQLVPATASAVVFTCDPVTRNDAEVTVCAVPGLGEPLVAGRVVPDTFVVDKRTGQVIERVPGEHESALLLVDSQVRSVPLTGVDGPCLDEEDLSALVTTALTVERKAAHPVDVEATLGDGEWQLLQARPITT